jgi:hypothetical protein
MSVSTCLREYSVIKHKQWVEYSIELLIIKLELIRANFSQLHEL